MKAGTTVTRKIPLPSKVTWADWQVDFKYWDVETDDSVVMEVSSTCEEGTFTIVRRLNGYHGDGQDWVKVDITGYASDGDTCIRLRVENDLIDSRRIERFAFTTTWVMACTCDDDANDNGICDPREPPVCPAKSRARDRFNTKSYHNNDGTMDWNGPWVERSEFDGPTTGHIKIANGNLVMQGVQSTIDRGLYLGGLPQRMWEWQVDFKYTNAHPNFKVCRSTSHIY